MDLEPDARRYRILDVIGRGGFGTVYRGEALGSGGFVKEVALKVLHPHVEANAEQLARLREEARLLALLKHRAIVGVDTLTRIHERWTVVMEYVPGVTVRDLLERSGPMPLPMVLEICADVASALDAAYRATGADGHPLKMLHRDVKPSNLQLTRWGDVKLLDFGIARAETPNREISTGAVVYGSIPYLAPERLTLRDTHQADVYALALTLVQMATGEVPTPGAPNPDRIEHARQLLEGIAAPAALVDLVARSLAFDPEDRPDARGFERELQRVRHRLTVFDPREWSEEHVGAMLDARSPSAGELTGMSFAEGSSAQNLFEALGTRVPATFDDPVDPPRADPDPTPRTPIPSTVPPAILADASGGILETPPGSARSPDDSAPLPPLADARRPEDSGPVFPELPARAERAPGTPRPALRRRSGNPKGAVTVVLASLIGLGGVAGGAALVALVGMMAAAVAGVVGALFWSPGMCHSFVGTTREEARAGGFDREVSRLLDDADGACERGEITAWDVNMLDVRMDDLASDGSLSRSDVEQLERALDRLRAQ